MAEDFIQRAKPWPKGNKFEDFSVGQTFEHHWGRTILHHDTVLFSTLTLSYNPMYFNRAYAMAHGHPDIVVNPQLLLNMVFGMSVQDCSEVGGPFLGLFDCQFMRPVYPGVTIVARSITTETRVSSSNPRNGIVTWETSGVEESGETIVRFRRSNLVQRRNPEAN